jgi:hypothetical protein
MLAGVIMLFLTSPIALRDVERTETVPDSGAVREYL